MALRAKKVKALAWVDPSLHRINAYKGESVGQLHVLIGAVVTVDGGAKPTPEVGLAPRQELVSRAGMIRASALYE